MDVPSFPLDAGASMARSQAVGGEQSAVADLGEGPDNAERYRKTARGLVVRNAQPEFLDVRQLLGFGPLSGK